MRTPFPNIKRCKLSTEEFVKKFDEHLAGELQSLESEEDADNRALASQLNGTWITVTQEQAVWRGPGYIQSVAKSLCRLPHWAYTTAERQSRPLELVYIRNPKGYDAGKILVDGPGDAQRTLCDMLRYCGTKYDDLPMVPRYDVTKMEW